MGFTSSLFSNYINPNTFAKLPPEQISTTVTVAGKQVRCHTTVRVYFVKELACWYGCCAVEQR
jgi:hypothetical protein